MRNTFRRMAALICLLMAVCIGCAGAEAPASPQATPVPTPGPEDLGKLLIQIEGPDPSMPTVIPYSDFTEGKYALEDLIPGTYTVKEIEPEKLLEGLKYTYDMKNSVQELTIEVKAEETTGDKLINIYKRPAEPTSPPDGEDAVISITVEKKWEDYNNRDGNRPERIAVHLLANGNEVAQAMLTSGSGWKYEFKDLPKYKDKKEIVYTVKEDSVPMYSVSIEGYSITNKYTPETTSVTVSKVWADNNNSAKLRPASVRVRLSNGQEVKLNEGNHWTATISNLPVFVNGKRVTYTWKEYEVIGYNLAGVQVSGNTTVFTNSLINRQENPPPEGKKVTNKKRGKTFLLIEDYGTPLGVEVVINHVGDCFD